MQGRQGGGLQGSMAGSNDPSGPTLLELLCWQNAAAPSDSL